MTYHLKLLFDCWYSWIIMTYHLKLLALIRDFTDSGPFYTSILHFLQTQDPFTDQNNALIRDFTPSHTNLVLYFQKYIPPLRSNFTLSTGILLNYTPLTHLFTQFYRHTPLFVSIFQFKRNHKGTARARVRLDQARTHRRARLFGILLRNIPHNFMRAQAHA